MRTVIHVNQHVIRSNRKKSERNPVLTVKTWQDTQAAHEVVILDTAGQPVARIVYRPDQPLSCGAHVWIETECAVQLQPATPALTRCEL